jgi:hypothetical protein
MSLLDDTAVFAAYLYDEADHLLGGQSTLAAELAIQADPALSAIAQPGWNGAPTTQQGQELLGEVVQAEEQSFPDALQNNDQNPPSLLGWQIAAGAVLLIAGIAAVGYTVRAFR